MTYPEPSSQVLGRNLWQSGNKHSKLHLVSFKLRFFEDAADERGNQMAVVEVKKKKRGILYLSFLPRKFYSLHQTLKKEATPAGRRNLPGQRIHLEDSF